MNIAVDNLASFLMSSMNPWILTLYTFYSIPFSVIGGVFIIAGLYLVTWARYNEARRVLTIGYLDPLLVEDPPASKTQGSSSSGFMDP
uniref:WAT1-related protein n=1 Tax=Arundo donax TaxID=35708 RepID=A0A0A9EXY7_ARUDO